MFVADLHNDVVQRAMIGEDIAQRTDVGHSDLVRLRESCIDLEILVVWASKIPPRGKRICDCQCNVRCNRSPSNKK